MLKGGSYSEVLRNFRWKVPEYYNIGVDVCDKWVDETDRPALLYEDEHGQRVRYTFRDLKRLSNRLANTLLAHGFSAGDRLGILLPQCAETALAHIAAFKIGGITVPLFTLFGPDALEYRLGDSGAKAVVTDETNLSKILEIQDKLPDLQQVILTKGPAPPGVIDFWTALDRASDDLHPVQTKSDDPALLIYTSGTTGPPKGALHGHRVVLGHLPGVAFPHDFFPQKGDLFWTPADWAWAGGLLDVLLPSWHWGVPVLAFRAKKFDPEQAFQKIAEYNVRNAFMPPTALKMMRRVKNPREKYNYRIRSIGCGGEPLGEKLLEWGRETMGLTINEFYGMTEVNLIVGNCAVIMEVRPGSMGRPIPGHRVDIIDETGRPVPAGEVGEVATMRPDPVMFIEYWNKPEATAKKFIGDWCCSGDMARKDEDGYFWFVGRKDDLITSAGYRIGPSEIEDCLIKHPSVAMSAVIGSPDEIRGEVVKAFIVLQPEVEPTEGLKTEIQEFVKNRLAAHEFPRKLEFVEALPMTATGKIKRNELRAGEQD
jgi:acetyl-CoA synthetase